MTDTNQPQQDSFMTDFSTDSERSDLAWKLSNMYPDGWHAIADYILAREAKLIRDAEIALLQRIQQEMAMHTVPEGKGLVSRSYLNNTLDFMIHFQQREGEV